MSSRQNKENHLEPVMQSILFTLYYYIIFYYLFYYYYIIYYIIFIYYYIYIIIFILLKLYYLPYRNTFEFATGKFELHRLSSPGITDKTQI